MKVEMTFEDLKTLIEVESEKREPNTDVVKISRSKLIEGLESTEKDIIDKFNQARKLWRKNMKLYRNFLSKSPGSKQMRSPGPIPTLPSSYEDFKGYKRMMESVSDEELNVEWNFLKEIFRLTAKAVEEVRVMRDSYQLASAGTAPVYMG